jgi:hypothetical protein
MEEMMDDTLDMQEDEDIEEEADAEVDKVLFELTDGKLGMVGSVGTELPVSVCLSSSIDLDLTNFTDTASKAGRGRDRENNGTISATAEWFIERVMRLRWSDIFITPLVLLHVCTSYMYFRIICTVIRHHVLRTSSEDFDSELQVVPLRIFIKNFIFPGPE